MTEQTPTVAFIGFGEAASAFLAGWRTEAAVECTAYDVKTDAPADPVRKAKLADYRAAAMDGRVTLADALTNASLVFSMVSPDQALAAANEAAAHLRPGALFLDCNSCSPGTKRRAAEVIEGAGGCYVDVAVMAPVYPARHKTPLLVSGPHGAAALEELKRLHMVAALAEGPVGNASSVKMVRSIMVKGLEALMAECVLAGRLAGVEDAVLQSLAQTFPGIDWPDTAAYMLERVAKHGVRRAAELGEVGATLDELGLNGPMTRAATDWQATIGNLSVNLTDPGYQARADAVLAALEPNPKQRAHP